MIAALSRLWKSAIASREIEVGSGRSRPAENVAFAMASSCEAIAQIKRTSHEVR